MMRICRLPWRFFRRSGKLVLGVGGMLLWLSTGQPQMAQSHDMHQHHHPAPTKETGEEASLSKMTIPDVVLMNQDGEPVHFYSDLVKGKVVAINTIFTTCTTICPPMGANFAKLQRLMGDRAGKDFALISISVDPATDTPQRLKAWSEKFHAGPGWTLLTGPKQEVDHLLKALKVFTPDKWDHAPIVLVGNDARGEWTRAYGLAPPDKLAEIMTDMMGSTTKKSSSQEAGQK